MDKKNYRIEMERELQRLRAQALPRRATLVLHSCCAPCSSAVLEELSRDLEIIVFYYNPNISPKAEFEHRAEEQRRLIEAMGLAGRVQLRVGVYEPEAFYERVRGLEAEREGGERCTRCFEMRLEETARLAKQLNADYFTTTLSISPLKDAQRLNAIGARMAEVYGVRYLFSDFKKKNGYGRSCELSEQYGLYRQDFCGCIFSKLERERERAERSSSLNEK